MNGAVVKNIKKFEVPVRGKILSLGEITKELLIVVDSCLDYSKVDVKSVMRSTGSQEVQANSAFRGIFAKLSSKCENCRGERSFTNSCGHGYCKRCAGNLIEKTTGCDTCHNPISEQFLIDVLKVNYTKKINILCKRCKANKAYINSNTGCGHLCKMCISEIIDECENTCFVCGYELLEMGEIFSRKKICGGCQLKRYCIGDRLSKVCSCGKRLCLTCMEGMLYDKRCACCKKNLTQKEVLEIYKRCCATCALCYENYSNTFMVRKLCCKIKICAKCDQNGKHYCIKAKELSMSYHKS